MIKSYSCGMFLRKKCISHGGHYGKNIIVDRAPHLFSSSNFRVERERSARARWLASGVNLH